MVLIFFFEVTMTDNKTPASEMNDIIQEAQGIIRDSQGLLNPGVREYKPLGEDENPLDGCSFAEKIAMYLSACRGEFGIRRLVENYNKKIILHKGQGKVRPINRTRVAKLVRGDVEPTDLEREIINEVIFEDSLKTPVAVKKALKIKGPRSPLPKLDKPD